MTPGTLKELIEAQADRRGQEPYLIFEDDGRVVTYRDLDRITSQANPRTLERVPAGARFQVRFVMDVLAEEDAPLLGRLLEGLRLLEDDALGGGGSRGSGRVRFANLQLTWRGRTYYASGAAQKDLATGADLAALQTQVNESGYDFIREE